MVELVENFCVVFGECIDGLDWMGEEIKVNVKVKLVVFCFKIGYFDEWIFYEGLLIIVDDLLINEYNLCKFFRVQELEEELKFINCERWGMILQ